MLMYNLYLSIHLGQKWRICGLDVPSTFYDKVKI